MNYIQLTESRIEEIVELWNKEIGEDFPMRESLFKQNSLQDVNVQKEHSLIAVNKENKVVGFIVVKTFEETELVKMHEDSGWIQVLLVDSSYRNQGIGSELLGQAERYFLSQGKKQILIGSDPFHYFPGVPSNYIGVCEWLEGKGYQRSNTEVDLVCSYDQNELIEEPDANTVTYELATKEDEVELISFLQRCFPGRWEYEAKKYFAQGCTGREFVLLKTAGEIKGFCRINDQKSKLIAQNIYWAPLFSDELGGVGPLGVDESERGKGYGLSIVKAGIAFLRKRNINNIVIDWTTLIEFYEKLGYRVWKTYETYSKKL